MYYRTVCSICTIHIGVSQNIWSYESVPVSREHAPENYVVTDVMQLSEIDLTEVEGETMESKEIKLFMFMLQLTASTRGGCYLCKVCV